jgi:hypothetical protein
MGRLRQAGTCIIFTTGDDLRAIILKRFSAHACEMAELVLENRTAGSLQDAIYKVMDAPIEAKEGEGAGEDAPATFRYDVFQHFCVQLQRQVAELQDGGSCSFCKIMDRPEATQHVNRDCPACKRICGGCFELGHNRQSCKSNHRRIAGGFCVMCLMPVQSVYGIHSSRYGKECSGELRDCMKPLVTLLYHSSGSHVILHAVSQFLWSPKCPKPPTFTQYWAWLWHESGDHVFGILKLLHALVQCVTNRNRG